MQWDKDFLSLKYLYKVNEIGIIILTGSLKMKLKIHMKEQRGLPSIDL